ncbi:ABC transporter ATP-binding protein [Microlunatus elymi]|uniref:ABC transporter ATP-binding protein n=1 Tax=Microlunatus elymi TaxID=2596828 RepID=A0A516Q263_9ACTN|nr:ABC transporter ATP-binding protein [Microlunatus elymi]QDP97462.1 ABC transporter ATP-binding protein [Microlunatus elymi]
MVNRLTDRAEWKFFAVLPRADPALAVVWWSLLILTGILPAVFSVAMGVLIGQVEASRQPGGVGAVGWALAFTGLVFVLMQVLPPVQQAVSLNLGSKVSAWLNDTLVRACIEPPGMAHLEDPQLAEDLTVAREFDRGQTGPPMFLNVDFLAGGLLGIVSGLASAVVLAGFAWWAPLVLILCWGSTHWLLRESGVWRDRRTPEVQEAQRHADYAYRLATDPLPAKELRLFGLAGWTVDRFITRRRRLFELQYRATRLRERSVLLALLVVAAGNVLVFGMLGAAAISGRLGLDRTVTFVQVAIGVSLIAFGGLNWVMDGASAPVAAVLRLATAMAPAGSLATDSPQSPEPVEGPPSQPQGPEPAEGPPSQPGHMIPPAQSSSHTADLGPPEITLRDLHFSYPRTEREIFSGLDLTIPAGSSMAIVGQNGAGKTTLAKLLCRFYDPTGGAVESDGVDLRAQPPEDWRRRVTAVFQDFVRFELPLRENVAPGRSDADDEDILAALRASGADRFAELDTVLAKGYRDGTDLSGGQWQRIALARALYAVGRGAGLVLLDEPTAQLDVRGEAIIFDRVLAATRQATTVLISHRFSTVRHVDRICVLEHGRVIEVGSHDELMERGGRYRTMFDLQAKRFGAAVDEEGMSFDVLG